MGVLGCPRVKKVRVTLPSLLVRERKASHCNPQQLMNSYTTFKKNSCPDIILGGDIDI